MKKATTHRAGPCGPSFRFMMLATGCLLVAMAWQPPAHAQTARAQFVHASPDPAVESIDVYFDEALILDDFAYRTGTPFMDVPAGQEIMVALADSASTSSAEAVASFPVTFQADETYYVVAVGYLDPAAFPPNPDGKDTGLSLAIDPFARESGRSPTDGEFDFRLFHALPDAPAITFLGTLPSGETFELISNLPFGTFSAWDTGPPVPGVRGRWVLAADHSEQLHAGISDFTGMDGESFLTLVTGTYADPTGIKVWDLLPNGEILLGDNVTAVDPDGASATVPETFRLLGNYPNPFNPSTTVLIDLPQPATVRLAIFDLLGRQVLRLPESTLSAGAGQHLRVDASTLPSGLYVYRVTAEMAGTTQTRTGRMVLVK